MSFFRVVLLLPLLAFAGCATTEHVIASPSVQLTSVELAKANFGSQTFVLGFNVHNPNSFPLPVKSVKYRILFDEESFARGETPGSFTIPARSDGSFNLTVDVDFLGSAAHITSLLGGGVPDHVDYELQGTLAVDIPLVRPLAFTNSGIIPID